MRAPDADINIVLNILKLLKKQQASKEAEIRLSPLKYGLRHGYHCKGINDPCVCHVFLVQSLLTSHRMERTALSFSQVIQLFSLASTAAARVRARVWQVGFVVYKVASVQVFSEYFGFPCRNRLFHQLFHPHNHPGQVQ
jgi:hypothetical protein